MRKVTQKQVVQEYIARNCDFCNEPILPVKYNDSVLDFYTEHAEYIDNDSTRYETDICISCLLKVVVPALKKVGVRFYNNYNEDVTGEI